MIPSLTISPTLSLKWLAKASCSSFGGISILLIVILSGILLQLRFFARFTASQSILLFPGTIPLLTEFLIWEWKWFLISMLSWVMRSLVVWSLVNLKRFISRLRKLSLFLITGFGWHELTVVLFTNGTIGQILSTMLIKIFSKTFQQVWLSTYGPPKSTGASSLSNHSFE